MYGENGTVLQAAREIAHEMSQVDRALYAAVAATPTPYLDDGLRNLSRAADKSVLWMAVAGGMAALGGPRQRRAAATGLASIGVASLLVNAGFKSLARRKRPERQEEPGTGTCPCPPPRRSHRDTRPRRSPSRKGSPPSHPSCPSHCIWPRSRSPTHECTPAFTTPVMS